ncbi:thioredoxin fold domain-containing protein [Dyadobacter sp. CY356]|uniref:thioredoxin family protein n=1 Tax=Dyadobacter sp. CY356 TaxID=2906442 RepID=UPI001F2531ED|nr:thioredoxin fold domain-containing protein [Dyadobacter sp. CY356]MCF0059460.1 thioredoxin family protein [Dyadobacter sp. CY356]
MKGFKHIIYLLAVVALTFSIAEAADGRKNETKVNADAGIKFTGGNWASILKKAKAENKIIFLDAYTTWCGPCKLLQKNVFTKPEVGALFNQKFINVKVDMESGEGPKLAQKYPLEGYPTLFFIDGDGKIVKQVIGYQNPETLVSIGKAI